MRNKPAQGQTLVEILRPLDLEAVLLTLLEGLATAPLAHAATLESADEMHVLARFDLNGFEYAVTRSRSAPVARLSPRELEIVRLVASGLSNKSIGAALDISTWTVATYLRRIFVKLGVTSRAAMVARVAFRPALSAAESKVKIAEHPGGFEVVCR